MKAPVETVWRALTDPAIVAAWFGDLDGPLDRGRNAHLEFGDGDFFTLEDVRLAPPRSLQYSWRFLGVGPRDTVRWTLAPGAEGCVVTVTDEEEGRSPEEARQLRKGWLDFTRRLRDYLQKGETTRYTWRHDFDGSVELPGDLEVVREKLLSPQTQSRWLPLSADAAVCDGTYFHPADGEEPSRFLVTRAEWQSPDHLSFRLSAPDWNRPTLCEIKLSRRSRATLLFVSHRGWKLIGADRDYQKRQRRRFCQLWVGSLTKARHVTAAS